MGFVIPMLPVLALMLGQVVYTREDIFIKSDDPPYELHLPKAYEHSVPRETPPRYVRSSGRESWAKVSVIVTAMAQQLPQNPTGITEQEILPLVSPPPDAASTFSRRTWQELEIGVIEYRAVVADLRVIGLSTILPLVGKGLRITVYAPDPLEKDVREDFQLLLATISKTKTNWFTDEALRKIALMEKVSIAGGVLLALYPVAWVIIFRGHPHLAHWPRCAWLFAIALLLFIPITSPGPATLVNNLVVNALVPVIYVMLTIRRLKLGIELD